MTNEKLEKVEKVLNDILAKLFPEPEDETERINSARVTANRLKAFNRTIQNAQFELPDHMITDSKQNSDKAQNHDLLNR